MPNCLEPVDGVLALDIFADTADAVEYGSSVIARESGYQALSGVLRSRDVNPESGSASQLSSTCGSVLDVWISEYVTFRIARGQKKVKTW